VSDTVGIALRESHLDIVALRRGLRGPRVLATFSVPADDDASATLRRRLREAGVRARRAHVGLPRRSVIAKVVELPLVPGVDVRRMVGFELERHLPFPPDDCVFDFEVLDATPGQPMRLLLVAAERRLVERVRAILRDAGLVPRHIGVAIHSLARRVAPPTGPGRIVVWIEETEAELAIVVRGRTVASRAFPLPVEEEARARALGAELERTLASVGETERAGVAEILTGGLAPPLTGADLSVRPVADLAHGVPGAAQTSPLALAAALERPARGRPAASLLPEALRPRPFPWPLATTAALGLVVLLLASSIPAVTLWRERRSLAALDRRIARLAPAVQRAERLAADVERARRELGALRDFEAQGLRALPLLRELTEAVPADVWLTSLTADRNGIELAGFASSASQLIPLLEASPRLERVEFTSPVTKGRDREQFRLKAAWEGRGGGR
jgi:Tfp pilus assembly protein PilN